MSKEVPYIKNKVLRENLWRANPNCHYCDTPTIPPELCKKMVKKNGVMVEAQDYPDNMATVDHVYTRFDEERWDGQNRYVVNLSCYKCNHDLGKKREKEVPIEELRARSSHSDYTVKPKNKFENIDELFDGSKIIDEYFEELKIRKEKLNNKIKQLHDLFKIEGRFERHVNFVLVGMKSKIERCNEENGGYEKTLNGEFCEITPTESFNMLFEYFREHGDSSKTDEEDFLSEQYELNEYTMKLYQGQGCFYRLYKNKEELIQI